MGLFSFSQYDLLNKSQRPRLQRARSTDVTGNRLTAPAHTETRPAPKKGTDRYNLKRASFVSMMCIRAIVRPVLFHGPRYIHPLQSEISHR